MTELRLEVRGRARHRGMVLAALAAALLLHAGLLGGMQAAAPLRDLPVRAEPVTVRTVPVPQARVEAAEPVAVAAAEVPPVPAVPAAPAVTPAPAKPAAPPRPKRAATPAAAPGPSVPASTPAAAPTAPSADAAPLYRTQFPPGLLLRYELRRGALRGSGDMRWRPRADGYELALDGRVAGLSVLAQVSQGGFDAAGLAPLRFTDQRLRRGKVAANFQRAAGKITYSGPSSEFPLRPGTQDRLSWMMQLAAIVAAEPRLRATDAHVAMWVTGARGDLSLWDFHARGSEAVGGVANALHYNREPRGAYDTSVDVWLDPARHHVPVRAVMGAGDDGSTFELRLLSIEAQP